MKLQDQVANLELSKKLKELGVEQRSLFNWINENEIRDEWEIRVESADYEFDCPIEIICSAFTVAELGEMLPPQIKYGENEPFLTCTKDLAAGWIVCYAFIKKGATGKVVHADTEADARAKMLIYLIENKLITL